MFNSDKQKEQHLRNCGAWNATADAVEDSLFDDSEFFDRRDVIQVKYEMLRRVRVDCMSVMEAAQHFGLSRAGYYKVRSAYQRAGLIGLIPARPGPRQAHKLTGEILEFIDEQLSVQGELSASQLAALVLRKRKLSVHPRSIERALARRKKIRREKKGS